MSILLSEISTGRIQLAIWPSLKCTRHWMIWVVALALPLFAHLSLQWWVGYGPRGWWYSDPLGTAPALTGLRSVGETDVCVIWGQMRKGCLLFYFAFCYFMIAFYFKGSIRCRTLRNISKQIREISNICSPTIERELLATLMFCPQVVNCWLPFVFFTCFFFSHIYVCCILKTGHSWAL